MVARTQHSERVTLYGEQPAKTDTLYILCDETHTSTVFICDVTTHHVDGFATLLQYSNGGNVVYVLHVHVVYTQNAVVHSEAAKRRLYRRKKVLGYVYTLHAQKFPFSRSTSDDVRDGD